jgi:hypothetical protein
MATKIFLSFASKDVDFAKIICGALENHGATCWVASRDVPPGENFQAAIARAIRSSKVMVLIFSTNTNNSDEVKKELVLASRYKVAVIPVRVEDVLPDDAFTYELSIRQWIDLFKDWEHSIQTLLNRLIEIGGIEPELSRTVPSIGREGKPKRLISKTSRVVVLTLGVVVAVVSAWFVLSTESTPSKKAPTRSVALDSPVTPNVPNNSNAPNTSGSPAPSPDVTADALKNGDGAYSRKEFGEALAWYLKAAESGNGSAQLRLGWQYQNGLGTEADFAEAFRWYLSSAELGNGTAQDLTGFLYFKGWGTRQDFSQAMHWFQKAAQQGIGAAMYNVGLLYASARGVPLDRPKAREWMRKASDNGYGEATQWLKDDAKGKTIDNEPVIISPFDETCSLYSNITFVGNTGQADRNGVVCVGKDGKPH